VATRPEIVRIVRSRAFTALASAQVPDDTTPREEAEGLISYALYVLSREVGSQAAANEAQAIVDKYRDVTHG